MPPNSRVSRDLEAAYPPAKGDAGEGSTLTATFFAYKNKKATLYLSGLSGLAHGQGGRQQSHAGGIAWLLDHLVRSEENRVRNRHADLLRGLQIDHQLELRRLLYRQIGRLRTFEDFIDIIDYPPVHVRNVRPVGHESAG